MPDLASNIKNVEERIADACARAGRRPADITLVAVSKTFPAQAIVQAHMHGIRYFGENRVQEARTKIPETRQLDPPIHWHMIGTLQHRQVRDAVSLFEMIESLDSMELAQRLESRLAIAGGHMPVLIEINVAGETSKHGFPIGDRSGLTSAIEQIALFPHLEMRGLMTIAPIIREPEEARAYFHAMRELRSELQARFPNMSLNELSMGMSDDFEVAIEEGATLVRIGRAIFGPR